MARSKVTTAEEVKETAEAVEEVKTEPEKLMYVGPTIPGLAIQNTVYTEIPKAAAEAFKKEPQMRNLFVPILRYPAAEKSMRKGKGIIFRAYNKALKYKENKEKGGE